MEGSVYRRAPRLCVLRVFLSTQRRGSRRGTQRVGHFHGPIANPKIPSQNHSSDFRSRGKHKRNIRRRNLARLNAVERGFDAADKSG